MRGGRGWVGVGRGCVRAPAAGAVRAGGHAQAVHSGAEPGDVNLNLRRTRADIQSGSPRIS